MFRQSIVSLAIILSTSQLTACSSDDNTTEETMPTTYEFTNAAGNESSVSYSGQTARHLLILELNNYIASGLQADLDAQMFTTREEVLAKLLSFYRTTDEDYDLALGEQALTVETSPAAMQVTLKDISSSTKDLSGKIAGNDATGQHKDWSTEFVAFGDKGSQSPEQLIETLLNEIADNAESFLDGNSRNDALGNPITKVYLATDGRDLKQLVQKVLLGAVTFSQGADDYLDNDIDGKGLLSDNTNLVDGKSYTALEHQFDEGFGYFGAAVNYLSYTDEELASKGGRADWYGYHDTNADGMIDFKNEYNFGHSLNAAKRDLGTVENTTPTDFTAEAMNAFIAGRKIIADTMANELTSEQMANLLEQRDIAILAWEKAIASTVIHYINDTLDDYAAWSGSADNYTDLAKHWSELKGFFISLQFNRMSPLSDTNFEQINTLIADAPELDAENFDAYQQNLLQARDLLKSAYNFDNDNVENW